MTTPPPASSLQPPALSDFLAEPWLWVIILIIASLVELWIMYLALRDDARFCGHCEGWLDHEKAMTARLRNAEAVKTLPILEPEPDPESLLESLPVIS